MKLKEKVNVNMTHARIMVSFWDLPRWEDGLQAPPTILLRAKEWFNRDPSKSFVDFTREDRLLGWSDYNEEHGNFIKDIVDIEGHHFSIFNFDYVSSSLIFAYYCNTPSTWRTLDRLTYFIA